MVGCCVLVCGGFGVSTLGGCVGGCAGAWGTAVLKMAASCLNAIVCFYLRYGMGMDGIGCCSASVGSAAALVTASDGNRLGKFFWDGNISVVSDTCSNDVLGM